jgi:hypothetical protein
MKVIVDIAIACKATKGMHITMRKQFNAEVTLVPGMHLVDRIWESERKISGSTYNPEDESVYLGISPGIEECPTKKDCDEREAAYRSAGWRSAAEWK